MIRKWNPVLAVAAITSSNGKASFSSYGDWAWIVNLSPLYHGVALTRAANIGEWEWSLLFNIAVLVALGLVGLRFTSRRIAGLLLT